MIIGTITGATNATYTTTTAGNYYVDITNSCNSTSSAVATVTTNITTAITTHPASLSVCAGTSASFSVAATGTNLTYQWYKGATGNYWRNKFYINNQ
jgi:hypothetical protein